MFYLVFHFHLYDNEAIKLEIRLKCLLLYVDCIRNLFDSKYSRMLMGYFTIYSARSVIEIWFIFIIYDSPIWLSPNPYSFVIASEIYAESFLSGHSCILTEEAIHDCFSTTFLRNLLDWNSTITMSFSIWLKAEHNKKIAPYSHINIIEQYLRHYQSSRLHSIRYTSCWHQISVTQIQLGDCKDDGGKFLVVKGDGVNGQDHQKNA